MDEELKNKLLEYLGQLLYEIDNTYDWLEKNAKAEKINAAYVLLGIEGKIGKSVKWKSILNS